MAVNWEEIHQQINQWKAILQDYSNRFLNYLHYHGWTFTGAAIGAFAGGGSLLLIIAGAWLGYYISHQYNRTAERVEKAAEGVQIKLDQLAKQFQEKSDQVMAPVLIAQKIPDNIRNAANQAGEYMNTLVARFNPFDDAQSHTTSRSSSPTPSIQRNQPVHREYDFKWDRNLFSDDSSEGNDDRDDLGSDYDEYEDIERERDEDDIPRQGYFLQFINVFLPHNRSWDKLSRSSDDAGSEYSIQSSNDNRSAYYSANEEWNNPVEDRAKSVRSHSIN